MCEEKSPRRGEIYMVRNQATEETNDVYTRPGLIVSCDQMNTRSDSVLVAYLTTQKKQDRYAYGPFGNTGRPSYVNCSNVYAVYTSRLGRLVASLSETQMREVDRALENVFDLGYADDKSLQKAKTEIEVLKLQLSELQTENAAQKKKIEAHADEMMIRDLEIAVHKKMYEKAVGVIAAMRTEGDLPRAAGGRVFWPPEKEAEKLQKPSVATAAPAVPEVPVAPTKKPPVEEPKLVDINSASFNALRRLGMSSNVVLNVINHRPYQKVEDLKNISGVNAKMFAIIEKRICCVPVAPVEEPKLEEAVTAESVNTEKVNINAADAKEIHDKTGLSMTVCYGITGHRKRNGEYKTVEDLLNVPRFKKSHMEALKDKLEV